MKKRKCNFCGKHFTALDEYENCCDKCWLDGKKGKPNKEQEDERSVARDDAMKNKS